MKRLFLTLLLGVGLVLSSMPVSGAAAKIGATCPKVNTLVKSGNRVLVCAKVKTKLNWKVATSAQTLRFFAKSAPTPTPTPTTSLAYVVGDTGPGGGRIFYVAPTSFACGPTLSSFCNYLEAAPTTGAAAWTDAHYAWSATPTVAIGTTGTAIGTGYKNTLAMASQNSTAGYAGTISQPYRGPKGKTDWFLPSKDELAQLYLQRATVGGLVADYYWSSSERSASSAWDQYFAIGHPFTVSKYDEGYVRPVRAF